MKILVVSNNTSVLMNLCIRLESVFPLETIVQERDSLMAGKYAFNNKIDMIFADINMKRMNGVELVEFVKHDNPKVQAFLVGTAEEIFELTVSVPEDVDGILTYPFTDDLVVNMSADEKK